MEDHGRMAEEQTHVPSAAAEALNETIRYAMYSVFRVPAGKLPTNRAGLGEEVDQYLTGLAEKGVVVRGVYDLAGMRADADWMVWWHAPDIDSLQNAYSGLRRTGLGQVSEPVWSATGLHRAAEFNRSHSPAFMREVAPEKYICVYPFTRSYEWYVLPAEERRRMLAEHGRAAGPYPDVVANTISAFALGDYEWLLAFEAAQLHRIVDLMRDLRATEARLHVRDELPFYTGTRVPVRELVNDLP
jgi:peroxiredoxin